MYNMLFMLNHAYAKTYTPTEGLLNTTNGPNDMGTPSEYMIIYITSLQSGLLRVHITSHTDRFVQPQTQTFSNTNNLKHKHSQTQTISNTNNPQCTN